MQKNTYAIYKKATSRKKLTKELDMETEHEDCNLNEDFADTQGIISLRGNTHDRTETMKSGADCFSSRCSRLITVCLMLVLLVSIIVLLIKYTAMSTENVSGHDQHVQATANQTNDLTIENSQLKTKYNDLATENNQLQTRYTKLTTENNQLQTRYTKLTTENKQLQTSYTNLTTENNRLQTSYTNLATENNQLQTRYTNLTTENNKLQTRYTNLTTDNNQLRTRYTNLTTENNQLQTRYANLTTENNQLQTRYTNLTTENNQLQTRYTKLTTDNNQLQTRYNDLTTKLNQLQTRYNDQMKTDELQRLITKLSNLSGAKYFNDSIYWITETRQSWSASRRICKERKADLAIINSREEQEFINQQFRSNEAWIGLRDVNEEGTWNWRDGSALTTSFWWEGEPNDYDNNEDCGITNFRLAESNISTWADYPCNHPVLGLCEM